MIIEFRRVSRAGNNVHAEMYFDGVVVAPNMNMTPKEWVIFISMLNCGCEDCGNEQVTISET